MVTSLDLEERGRLLAKDAYHIDMVTAGAARLPFIATSQWFLESLILRDKMLDEVSKVTWYPEWGAQADFALDQQCSGLVYLDRDIGIPLPIPGLVPPLRQDRRYRHRCRASRRRADKSYLIRTGPTSILSS